MKTASGYCRRHRRLVGAIVASALAATAALGAASVGAMAQPIGRSVAVVGLQTAERISPPIPGGPGQSFATLPPGSALPSGAECAQRVRPAVEVRPENRVANQTRGPGSDSRYPRVDGDFVGTTDEILQWVACKWGIDADLVRAQAAKESYWYQSAEGDRTNNQSACHPTLRTSSGDCPESIGILQVRYLYHGTAFSGLGAIESTAYNADYTYAVWRECFEGGFGWLNDQDRGSEYAAGDALGCMGLWFAGRWDTGDAREYVAVIEQYLSDRIWATPEFVVGI